jgi:G:T-mismatch repair DNA endonuclease (very short patch repair protein)
MKCPYTLQEIIHYPSYVKTASKKYGVPQDELRFQVLKQNFGQEKTSFYFLKKFYIDLEYSLPMFKEVYGLSYNQTLFLLKYHNIKTRTSKEAAETKTTRAKFKATCINKYGQDNPSKTKKIKNKKRKTFLKNYGVDNIFKTNEFKKNLDKYFREKHGLSRREVVSQSNRKIWASKTQEEKDAWLDKSIRSEKAIESLFSATKGYNISSIEYRICNMLDILQIEYTQQLMIKYDTKKRKFYDVYLPHINLIIEVNGDYWHANPALYKANDIIHYRFANITAKHIWEKDQKKIDLAIKNGYSVEVWWEQDLKKLSETQLLDFLRVKLESYERKLLKNQKYKKNTKKATQV